MGVVFGELFENGAVLFVDAVGDVYGVDFGFEPGRRFPPLLALPDHLLQQHFFGVVFEVLHDGLEVDASADFLGVVHGFYFLNLADDGKGRQGLVVAAFVLDAHVVLQELQDPEVGGRLRHQVRG